MHRLRDPSTVEFRTWLSSRICIAKRACQLRSQCFIACRSKWRRFIAALRIDGIDAPCVFDGDPLLVLPSRPGEFHPEPLTDLDRILSHHPAHAIDIAREVMRIWTDDKSLGEVIAELQSIFPHATPGELARACFVAADQVDMWREEVKDGGASELFDLMISGAPRSEITAAVRRMTDCTPDNIFPRKPRADAS